MKNVELLAAEVLERAVRIDLLVKQSTKQLAISFRKDTAQLAAAIQIRQLVESLVLVPLLDIFASDGDEQMRLDLVKSLLETVAVIHEGALPTVPRLIEPIELRSYLRQSAANNQGAAEAKKPVPLVFASERLGMQVYPNSLAGLLHRIANRQNLIARARHDIGAIKEFAIAVLKGKVDPYDQAADTTAHPYVAIPAVDINNPNRWPSLWHELAHHDLQAAPSLIDRFEEFVKGKNPQSTAFRQLCLDIAPLVSDSIAPEELESTHVIERCRDLIANWLRECWCDAHGVRQAGLAFLYSQLHDFMFCFPSYLAQVLQPGQFYPPAEFRLALAGNLALERLRSNASETGSEHISRIIDDYEAEAGRLHEIAGTQRDHGPLSACVSLLLTYFLAFLKKTGNFDVEKNFGGDISAEVFRVLEADLKAGFPIPSTTGLGNSPRACRVSEIVLAGWRNRNTELRSELITALKESSQLESKERKVATLLAKGSLLIDRSDESIKRSVQVAEWFTILHDEISDSKKSPYLRTDNASGPGELPSQASVPNEPFVAPVGLLSDNDINQLLDISSEPKDGNGRLRIVPLIDRNRQISGSTIDLRLGHNFEVFQALVESVVDACDSDVDMRQDSLEVEIDFLQGLSILPGQFVLGHSLEYIKLPRNVAAQIEGRSSFARLGIQVHMTANLVEAGFDGCLTLEIHNNGPVTVVLYPGMRIAQLRLFRMASTPSAPYDRGTSKYRGQLSHNKTKQFTDPEVDIFRRAKERAR